MTPKVWKASNGLWFCRSTDERGVHYTGVSTTEAGARKKWEELVAAKKG